MDIVEWLQQWSSGLRIQDNVCGELFKLETLDNPGWALTVQLKSEDLIHSINAKYKRTNSGRTWDSISYNDNILNAYCDEKSLCRVMRTLIKLVDEDAVVDDTDRRLKWLEDWYAFNCDGDWEHSYGVTFIMKEHTGWSVAINVSNMIFSETNDSSKIICTPNNDNEQYQLNDGYFYGDTDSNNLSSLLDVFINTIEGHKDEGYTQDFYEMKEYTRSQHEYLRSIGEDVW